MNCYYKCLLVNIPVISYYPSCRYAITDNAKDLSGTMALLIRYLTYSIRINTQEKCIPLSECILPLALIALNNTNYSRLNYSISPHIINTGIRTDFSFIFATLDDDYLYKAGFSSYAIALNKSQFVNFYLLTYL